jgi:hypothetical protein
VDKEKVLVPELRPPEIVKRIPRERPITLTFSPAPGTVPGEWVDKDGVPGGGPRDSNPDPGIGS